MRIFIIDKDNNSDIVNCLNKQHIVESDIRNLKKCKVVLVGKTLNIRGALNLIDISLQMGLEVICIKSNSFVCKLLISEGAPFI